MYVNKMMKIVIFFGVIAISDDAEIDVSLVGVFWVFETVEKKKSQKLLLSSFQMAVSSSRARFHGQGMVLTHRE